MVWMWRYQSDGRDDEDERHKQVRSTVRRLGEKIHNTDIDITGPRSNPAYVRTRAAAFVMVGWVGD